MKPMPITTEFDFESELPKGTLFFTVRHLARMLGVSDNHVFNLIDTGEIEIGVDLRSRKGSRSCIRIPRSSIIHFLNRRKTA